MFYSSHQRKPKARGAQRKTKRFKFTRRKSVRYHVSEILGQYPPNSGDSPEGYLVQKANCNKLYIQAATLRKTAKVQLEEFHKLPLAERELWEFAYVVAVKWDVHPVTSEIMQIYQLAWTAEGYHPSWVLKCNIHVDGGSVDDLPRGELGYRNAIKTLENAWMASVRLVEGRWVPCKAVARK
ncbi:hypothetical protein BV898_19124 [Hypsibius exemplaris]|uniref:Uncharacterized protein n=1 Tax=Hypsibius exemplaris TaxID=2072580 RepID=A0A9X6RNT5_HYPEX|nr:hypothetical protein BV898_19124 [Hypsibius exemplaris]